MIFREATIQDIPQIQRVRNSVQENTLSGSSLVIDADCAEYLAQRGKGWVCEAENGVIAFAIADIKDHNIWALFVNPKFEKKGIGKQLHDLMMDWYFKQTQEPVWLSTAFGTRAEQFYRKTGWMETGTHGTKEIKFEMTPEKWKEMKRENL